VAMSLLELTREVDSDGTVVLFPSGEVDPWMAMQFRDEAMGLIASYKPIAFDLRGVTYLPPESVAALVDVSRTLVTFDRPRLELRNIPYALKCRMMEARQLWPFRVASVID
jgi:hypothetical protein